MLGTQIDIDATVIDEPDQQIRTQIQEYSRGDRYAFDLTVTYQTE